MDECVAAKRRHNAVETEGRSYGVSRMHSPPCKGGVDATSRKYREASSDGADGVVAHTVIARAYIRHLAYSRSAKLKIEASVRTGWSAVRN